VQAAYHNAQFNKRKKKKKIKWPRYRPGVAQRVGRGIALLFHDLGTRRGWVVSVTTRPYFTHGKEPVPIVQEAGWDPGPVWRGAENLAPTGNRSPDRPDRSQSLYRLSYRAHSSTNVKYVNLYHFSFLFHIFPSSVKQTCHLIVYILIYSQSKIFTLPGRYAA
jgi:hypothetical protein